VEAPRPRDRSAADARARALHAEHRYAVYAHALRLTRGDADWAEDVVQETFLRAWRHWERLTPEHGSVRGWLLRVAHNLVMDRYRSARMRHGEAPLPESHDPPAPDPTDQLLTTCVVRELLGRLPDPYRQALHATYLRDQTSAQAAEQLHIPVGTVKSRVFYGLRMLRSLAQPDEPDPAAAA
jgi:RNA polymerase sigma-70 factor, ECF subfamily